MKNIAFFITHKTLMHEHAELSMQSLSLQDSSNKFDKLYLYNTHPEELSNNYLFGLIEKYNLSNLFDQIEVFPHDVTNVTTLAGIVSTIKDYVKDQYNRNDRILILKSDCLLSKNYVKDIFNLPEDQMVFFVAPFVCAKKRVPNNEILEYIKRDTFVRSDDITFFVEDKDGPGGTDLTDRKDVGIHDEQIKFTSCYVITDFSCHVISVGLFERITLAEQSWGGVKFYNLLDFFNSTSDSFVVHKFHDVISDNRQTDREGPVKGWLES